MDTAQSSSTLIALRGRRAYVSVTGDFECPSCDETGPHDDNGASGEQQSFCCRGCGEHFDLYDLFEQLGV